MYLLRKLKGNKYFEIKVYNNSVKINKFKDLISIAQNKCYQQL